MEFADPPRTFLRSSVVPLNRGGFTLAEIAVVMAVTITLMAALSVVLTQASNTLGEGLRAADLDDTLRRVATRIHADLKDSGSDADGLNYVASHPFTSDTRAAEVTVRRRLGFAGTAADWGPPITYSLGPSAGEDPNDGVDNDSDGVIDEQHVLRTASGETVIIADGATSLVFQRRAGEYVIDYAITASRRIEIDSESTTRVIATSVALRNRP